MIKAGILNFIISNVIIDRKNYFFNFLDFINCFMSNRQDVLKFKQLLLVSLLILSSCGDAAHIKKVSCEKSNEVCSKTFKDFFANFNRLPSLKINTCCIDVSQSKIYKQIDCNDYQLLLAHYKGPVIALGFLPDTLNYYGLVYCTAAATYFPNLALYNRRGDLIQTVPLASGCGSDVGYDCKEVFAFDGKYQFITTKREKQYEIDQSGAPNKKVAFESISKIKYTINERQIKIDTLL
jgi:hypothetical protein